MEEVKVRETKEEERGLEGKKQQEGGAKMEEVKVRKTKEEGEWEEKQKGGAEMIERWISEINYKEEEEFLRRMIEKVIHKKLKEMSQRFTEFAGSYIYLTKDEIDIQKLTDIVNTLFYNFNAKFNIDSIKEVVVKFAKSEKEETEEETEGKGELRFMFQLDNHLDYYSIFKILENIAFTEITLSNISEKLEQTKQYIDEMFIIIQAGIQKVLEIKNKFIDEIKSSSLYNEIKEE
ncbi:MAG: hypothetical protein QXY62_06290 [Candidatus Altiarchaeota archaeon]